MGLCTNGVAAWFTKPAAGQTCFHVGLQQDCPLVLFITFMDRMSRSRPGQEGLRFGNHRVSPLLLAHDVVQWASSNPDLQHAPRRPPAESEAAGRRITSDSEVGVLDWKRVDGPLQFGGEAQPQAEAFRNLRVWFPSTGRMEHEKDRRTGAASAGMQSGETGPLW